MRKYIYTILLILTSTIAFAQGSAQNTVTPPTGSTSAGAAAFVYNGTLTDSIAKRYFLKFPGGNYNEIFTGTRLNMYFLQKYDSLHYVTPWYFNQNMINVYNSDGITTDNRQLAIKSGTTLALEGYYTPIGAYAGLSISPGSEINMSVTGDSTNSSYGQITFDSQNLEFDSYLAGLQRTLAFHGDGAIDLTDNYAYTGLKYAGTYNSTDPKWIPPLRVIDSLILAGVSISHNVYNIDGTLTSNRTVNLNGKFLNFSDTRTYFNISNNSFYLAARSTGGANGGSIQANGNNITMGTYYQGGTNYQGISFGDPTNGISVNDDNGLVGLVYNATYTSSNPNWLTSKAYVDAATSSSSANVSLRQLRTMSNIPSQTLTRPIAGDSVAQAFGKVIKRGDSTSTAISTANTNIAANTAALTTVRDTTLIGKSTFNTGNLVTGVGSLALTGMTLTSGVLDGTGSNDYTSHQAYVSTEDCQDKVDLFAAFTPIAADGSGNIYFQTMKNSYTAGTIIQVLHNGSTGTDSLLVMLWDRTAGKATTAYEYALPFTVATGYNYLVHQGKRTGGLLIDVWRSDGLHYQNNSLQQNVGNNYGDQWGYPTAGVYAGHVQINQFYYNTAFSRSPKIVAFMDSFGEGNSLSSYTGTYNNRYIYLLAQLLGLDQVAICARGGESSASISTRFAGELQWFSGAKYAYIPLGINDTDTTAWKANMISMATQCIAKGVIPIFATITPRSDASNNHAIVLQQNNWIRNSGYRYIDLSAAFTINSDGLWARPGYQQGDSVHYTPLGGIALLNQVMHDAPYLLTGGPDTTALYVHRMKLPTVTGAGPTGTIVGDGFSLNTTSTRLNIIGPGSTLLEFETYASILGNPHTPTNLWNFTNNLKSTLANASKNAITSYRNQTLSSGSSGGGVAFDGNDGAGTEVTMANLYGSMVTNTTGSVSAALALNLPVAGTQTNLFNWYPTGDFVAGTSDGGYTGDFNRSGTNGYLRAGNLVVNASNVVNFNGSAQANAGLISVLTSSGNSFDAYRNQTLSTGAGTTTLQFSGNNGSAAKKIWASLNGGVTTNTSGSEAGFMAFNVIKAGTPTNTMQLFSPGDLTVGASPTDAGYTIDAPGYGLSGAFRAGSFTINGSGVPTIGAFTTAYGLPYISNTSGLTAETAQGASNTVLHGNGASAPTFSAIATADISVNAVTYAKIQTQSNNTILGNNSGSTGVPLALTAAQVSALIATATPQLITGTPTIVAGTGAGTSPTVSVTTNGKQLQVTVTTGTLPSGTNATIATVTLPNALSYTPYPVFSAGSGATALLNGASMVFMTSTGTANVTITSGTTGLTAATTYVWDITL